MTTPTSTPQIGQPVLCDGVLHTLIGYAKSESEVRELARQASDDPQVQDAIVAFTLQRGGYLIEGGEHVAVMKRNKITGELENTGRVEPRFRRVLQPGDLRWHDELGAWYLWGRCLTHEQADLVKELRDRGLVIARTTRTPGHAPAGGEHLDLYLGLFRGRPTSFWETQLELVRRGEGMTQEAHEAIADFRRRWEGPHTDGYAEPNDPPSTDLASKPTPAGRS